VLTFNASARARHMLRDLKPREPAAQRNKKQQRFETQCGPSAADLRHSTGNSFDATKLFFAH
jgi:hypothetical protein